MKVTACGLVFVLLCAVVIGAEQSSATGGDAVKSGLAAAAAGSAGKESVAVSSESLVIQPAPSDKTLRVPPGFRAKEGTTPEPYANTGWAKEVVHEKTGMEMVFIPVGEFEMGLSPSPSHHVRLTKPFYLGRYEVTQGEWQKVMGKNPSNFKGDRDPVETVSWNDCQEFVKKAGDGLRLPTEAEWEYACRAGSGGAYSFGDNEEDLSRYAWYGGNGGNQTHPVGEKGPNAWGLYDMHGNVCEWCADWYGHYPSGAVDDPRGPSGGNCRVVRGGCCDFTAPYCRSADRDCFVPSDCDEGIGVRVARTLD